MRPRSSAKAREIVRKRAAVSGRHILSATATAFIERRRRFERDDACWLMPGKKEYPSRVTWLALYSIYRRFPACNQAYLN